MAFFLIFLSYLLFFVSRFPQTYINKRILLLSFVIHDSFRHKKRRASVVFTFGIWRKTSEIFRHFVFFRPTTLVLNECVCVCGLFHHPYLFIKKKKKKALARWVKLIRETHISYIRNKFSTSLISLKDFT